MWSRSAARTADSEGGQGRVSREMRRNLKSNRPLLHCTKQMNIKQGGEFHGVGREGTQARWNGASHCDIGTCGCAKGKPRVEKVAHRAYCRGSCPSLMLPAHCGER